MRKISIKALYKNLSKELDLLPFQITKKGVPVAVVLGVAHKASLDQKIGLDPKQVKPKAKSRPKSAMNFVSPGIPLGVIDPFFKPNLKQCKKAKK